MSERPESTALSERLGLPRLAGQKGGRSFFAAIVIESFGVGLYLPISVLYFTRVSEIPLSTVGWCLSVAALIVLPSPLVIGHLVDRVRARPVVVVGTVLQGLAFLGYLLVREPWLLLATALFARAGERLFWSSLFTLVADLSKPVERDRWYALASASRNIGIGLGTVTVAVLLAIGDIAVYQLAVGSTGVLFLLASAVMLLRVPNGDHRDTEPAPDQAGRQGTDDASENTGPRTPSVWRDRPFLGFTLVNTCFALTVMIFGVGLPVYVNEGLGQPGWVVGVLTAVNIILLALTQTWVTGLVRHIRRTRVIAVAALLWSLWGVLMAGALALPGWLVFGYLLVIMLAFSAGELLHAPTANALAADASPPEARGRYLSVVQLSFAIAGVVAPSLFAQTFELGPAVPWLTLAALTLLASAAMLVLERRLPPRAVRL